VQSFNEQFHYEAEEKHRPGIVALVMAAGKQGHSRCGALVTHGAASAVLSLLFNSGVFGYGAKAKTFMSTPCPHKADR